MQINLIFATKVLHLAQFWKWEVLELVNVLIKHDWRTHIKNIKYGGFWRLLAAFAVWLALPREVKLECRDLLLFFCSRFQKEH